MFCDGRKMCLNLERRIGGNNRVFHFFIMRTCVTQTLASSVLIKEVSLFHTGMIVRKMLSCNAVLFVLIAIK